MVSFNCQRCQDVVKKPKVPSHAASCGSHSFSCVDCMKLFDLDSIKSHTSCVSEVQKYQGKWNKPLTKHYGPDSDDEDEEMRAKLEKEKKHAAAAAAARRRPRNMNFSDSDDESNDGDKKKAAQSHPHKKPANSAAEAAIKTSPKKKSPTPSPKLSPKLAPKAHIMKKANNHSEPVVCTFQVAHTGEDFSALVSSLIPNSETTVKAAAKLVCEKASSSKAMRQAIQKLIDETCHVKGGHVVKEE